MKNKKVLIAEDSSVVQMLTKRILQGQSYQICTARNGKEVLSFLKQDTADIILMDIGMPVMDGIECTQKIRKLPDEKKARIPIVAVTGNADNYSLDDFKNAGIDAFLQKPLDFDELVATVNDLTK